MKLSILLILFIMFASQKVFGEQRIKEAPEKGDIFEINKGIKGLVQGDIVPKRSRNTVLNETLHWPMAVVPFKYSRDFSLLAKGSIELAREEYRLRTCIDLVEADDATTNYINFENRIGCWSYVGMIGDGGQTISIGSGCENMAIVCHEIMHAIGIWHEQSRADRDGHVEIMWDRIEEGREHNFNKYGWDTTDTRGVPYDYTSVMHYGGTAFSKNGNPTIVTIDPDFQDIIGQRSTLSRGDSEKINKMYKCTDTLLTSYNCNYDDEAACGYTQENDADQIDWKRYEVGNKSNSISTAAPSVDATLGVPGKGSYMILDTSGIIYGDVGEMRSTRFVSRSKKQCFQLSFYIDKAESSNATIAAYLMSVDDITGEFTPNNDPIVTFAQNSGTNWQVHRMTLSAPPAFAIVFRGKTAGGYSEDVLAIDDVSVQDKACEDDYFVKQNYSNILNSYVKGDYFLSPVMTSNLGYKFRVQIYPHGTISSASGYMGVFFGLVQGPDDNNLAWPFFNKYVRLMIVDQNDNPLYALNKYRQFLTTQATGGDLWNQPEDPERPVGYYGYSNFVLISELQNTHNYLKHDSLMISVLIQDMNWVNGDENTKGTPKTVTENSTTGTPETVTGNSAAGTPETVTGNSSSETPETVTGNSSTGTAETVTGNSSTGTSQTVTGNSSTGTAETVAGNSAAETPETVTGNSAAKNAAYTMTLKIAIATIVTIMMMDTTKMATIMLIIMMATNMIVSSMATFYKRF